MTTKVGIRMTRFLFWNINRQDLTENICRLADRHGLDVLILAESPLNPRALEVILREQCTLRYYYSHGNCERIQMYTSFPSENIRPIREGARFTIRTMVLPSKVEVLLVGVHLRSKFYADPNSQMHDSRDLAEEIWKAEGECDHRRTLLVGDLNMNPFDPGIVGARSLNAVMCRETARKGFRRLQGKDYPFFYNPMWGHFGDLSDTPPATYYYPDGDDVCYYWYMLDQVMVRPDLLDYFDPRGVRVLDQDGDQSLLTDSGRVRRPRPSDHLPLLFDLML